MRCVAVRALLSAFALLAVWSCYVFDNPVDPGADNYQGFPSTPPTSTPLAPSSLALSAAGPDREHQLRLSWDDNADSEQGFVIERRVGAASFAVVGTAAVNATTYVDTSLSGETIYYFRVAAYNALGLSAYTNTAAWTTAPVAPSGLTATVVAADQIRLDWIDNASEETTFVVQWSTDGVAFEDRVPAGTLAANTMTWTDTGLSAATTYWYRVCAYSTASGGSSFTAAATATTP